MKQQERAVSQRRSSFSASSRSAGMLIVARTMNDEILSLSEGDGISMLCSEQRACPNSRLDSEMGIYSTGESKQNCVTTNDKREKRTLHVSIRLVRDDRLRCVGNQWPRTKTVWSEDNTGITTIAKAAMCQKGNIVPLDELVDPPPQFVGAGEAMYPSPESALRIPSPHANKA